MVKIDVDKILRDDESYYSFVIGVAKRAREITEEQLKKVKELSELDKGKSTVIDRSKQLPEELSLKPVRLAVEDIKAGRCHLAIESATEVLSRRRKPTRQPWRKNIIKSCWRRSRMQKTPLLMSSSKS